jgi:hypothetical protein
MIECYECRGELYFIEAVWVDPTTGKATTGDGGEPFHVKCAPAQHPEDGNHGDAHQGRDERDATMKLKEVR